VAVVGLIVVTPWLASRQLGPILRDFLSLTKPAKVLSLSFWRDDCGDPRMAPGRAAPMGQSKGRGELFRDYRLRIALVIRDYGMSEWAEAAADSKVRHR
jgi:hypothetical protein